MKFFLVDKMIHLEVGQEVHALKAITLTDPILHDHFPSLPIFPGTLILEGVAQAAGFLLELTYNVGDNPTKRAVFVQASKYKISKPTIPGDLLRYECKIESIIDDSAKISFEVKCHLSDEKRAKGLIQFQLMEIDSEEIQSQRKYIYKIWSKGIENCPEIR